MIVTSGLLTVALPSWINAQQLIRVDVNLKQLVVTVTDSEGVPVSNLDVQDFVVEIDGVPQNIEHFGIGERDSGRSCDAWNCNRHERQHDPEEQVGLSSGRS